MIKNLFLTLCVIGVTMAAESPVILFGVDGPQRASLRTIQAEDFRSIVAPLLRDHMIVVVQEENLTPHDFICKSNRTEQESCYSHLQSLSPKTYYYSVKNPETVFESLDPTFELNTISNNGKLETPMKCKAGKVVFLRFVEESFVSREDALEAHDLAVSQLIKQVFCPSIFLYTSTPAKADFAKKRSRRAISVSETEKHDYVFRSGSKFLIFFTKLAISTNGAAPIEIVITNMTIKDHNSTDFSVTLTNNDASATIAFDIELSAEYYYMKQLTYNKNSKFRTTEVNAPQRFSYYCGNWRIFANDGSNTYLIWNSLQFQAPFGLTKDENFKFGDSWNCVGFFSPAILAGLFVSLILLGILFTGICWMMDINTMDRFDDPKGKTITINANE